MECKAKNTSLTLIDKESIDSLVMMDLSQKPEKDAQSTSTSTSLVVQESHIWLNYLTKLLKESKDLQLLHHLESSQSQKKWWNAWLMINFKFTSSMVRDSNLQELLHVSTIILISTHTLEQQVLMTLKMKFHSQFWTFVTKTMFLEEDASSTLIKLLSKLETVTKTQSTHSLNQELQPRLDSSVWTKN